MLEIPYIPFILKVLRILKRPQSFNLLAILIDGLGCLCHKLYYHVYDFLGILKPQVTKFKFLLCSRTAAVHK